MDRKNFFYGQTVQKSDLDGAFDQVEKRFADWYVDSGSQGIALTPYRSGTSELTVLEQAVPNMTAKVKPGAAYTKEGKRLNVDTDQTVNCAVDKDGASTVPAAGNERYISLFALQDFQLTDQRLGPEGVVFFNKNVIAKFEVIAGTPAAIAVPPTAAKPALRTDAVLLADILIQATTTSVVEALIDRTRTEVSEIRAHSLRPDLYIDHRINLGEAVTVRENSWIFREAFPLAWVIFDGSPGGNPANPFTVKSKYNIVKVERSAVGVYKIFTPAGLFASADDAMCIASHASPFGGSNCSILDLADPANPFFSVATFLEVAGTDQADEPVHIAVVVFGRPSL